MQLFNTNYYTLNHTRTFVSCINLRVFSLGNISIWAISTFVLGVTPGWHQQINSGGTNNQSLSSLIFVECSLWCEGMSHTLRINATIHEVEWMEINIGKFLHLDLDVSLEDRLFSNSTCYQYSTEWIRLHTWKSFFWVLSSQ